MPIRHSTPDPAQNVLSSYLYKEHVYNVANEVGSSGDFDINRSSGGTTMRSTAPRNSGVVYQEEWSSGSSYGVNDIVTILTASTWDINSQTYDCPVGKYMCVKSTPTVNADIYSQLEPDIQAIFQGNYDSGLFCWYPTITTSSYWVLLGGGGAIKYSTYQYSSSYAKDELVRVTGSTIKYYSASYDEFSYPGTYIAIKPVQALASRDSGSFQMPYYPDSGSYWELISMMPTSMSVCIEGSTKKYWIDASEFEPDNCVSHSVL